MTRSTTGLPEELDAYLNDHVTEHPVLAELRDVTAPLPLSMMQISPSQGAYLAWLVQLLGAKRTIEIGVFTGYSAITTALALPDNGYILACDVNEEWTATASQYFKKAGVEHKIDLVLAPASKTLAERILAGESNSYDFAFIDADKPGYLDYYEKCLRLVRTGGVILFDNMLWGGSVADKSRQDESTRALREVNRRVTEDRRVSTALISVGDGLLAATKL